MLAAKQAIEQLLGRLAGDAGGIQSQDAMEANVVGIGGVYQTQMFPFADAGSLQTHYDFEKAVYDSRR
jgi:hypothetical protein